MCSARLVYMLTAQEMVYSRLTAAGEQTKRLLMMPDQEVQLLPQLLLGVKGFALPTLHDCQGTQLHVL
jgi:hypothetical protein